jgi:hypothetical protein
VYDLGGAHLSDSRRWRLEASGHAASRGAGRAAAEEGADVGAVMNGCRGGIVCAGAGVRMCGGGDAARRGKVGGAPTAASMKGPRWLCQRGPGKGVATAAKGSRHGSGNDDNGVPAKAAMMGSRRP